MPEPVAPGFDVLLPAGSLPAAGATAGPGRLTDATTLAEHYAYPSTADGRCWVRANMVTSLDGAAAGADGRSALLSGPADRRLFHVLRGLADVVLVGAGTARAEGYGPVTEHPELQGLRAAAGQRPAAVLVQVSRSGRAGAARGLFDRVGDAYVVVAMDDADAVDNAVDAAGEESVLLAPPAGIGGPDLAVVLAMLAARGLHRVLCEGGPSLLADLVAADLLDELCLTTSPVLGGGARLGLLGREVAEARPMSQAGLLQAGSTLFARWVRDRDR